MADLGRYNVSYQTIALFKWRMRAGGPSMVWVEWAVISQVLLFGILGAWASLVLMRREDYTHAKVRPFPSRLERWFVRHFTHDPERLELPAPPKARVKFRE